MGSPAAFESDAGELADDLEGFGGDGAGGEFGVGAFAQDEELARVAAGGEDAAEAFGEGDGGDEHGDGEADAQGGHKGGALALDEIAEIVGDGDAHAVNL